MTIKSCAVLRKYIKYCPRKARQHIDKTQNYKAPARLPSREAAAKASREDSKDSCKARDNSSSLIAHREFSAFHMAQLIKKRSPRGPGDIKAVHQSVHTLFSQGLSIVEIARTLRLSLYTVRRFLRARPFVLQQGW